MHKSLLRFLSRHPRTAFVVLLLCANGAFPNDTARRKPSPVNLDRAVAAVNVRKYFLDPTGDPDEFLAATQRAEGAAVALIAFLEGFLPYVHDGGGIPVIGCGSSIYYNNPDIPDGTRVRFGDAPITRELASLNIRGHLRHNVYGVIARHARRKLTFGEFVGLCSVAYTMSESGFANSAELNLVNNGGLLYCADGGRRNRPMNNRRWVERLVMAEKLCPTDLLGLPLGAAYDMDNSIIFDGEKYLFDFSDEKIAELMAIAGNGLTPMDFLTDDIAADVKKTTGMPLSIYYAANTKSPTR